MPRPRRLSLDAIAKKLDDDEMKFLIDHLRGQGAADERKRVVNQVVNFLNDRAAALFLSEKEDEAGVIRELAREVRAVLEQ